MGNALEVGESQFGGGIIYHSRDNRKVGARREVSIQIKSGSSDEGESQSDKEEGNGFVKIL